MFTVIYILEMNFDSRDATGEPWAVGEHTYDLLPYVLRVSSRIWRTREAAQDYADGVAKTRKAIVVQLPETYAPN